jgi:hypothetical protein
MCFSSLAAGMLDFQIIEFLGPENTEIAIEVSFLSYLAAEKCLGCLLSKFTVYVALFFHRTKFECLHGLHMIQV